MIVLVAWIIGALPLLIKDLELVRIGRSSVVQKMDPDIQNTTLFI